MTRDHWTEQLLELWRHWPKQPFQAVPYDSVAGVSWMIMDGDGRHIATVFEEESAMMIASRLNS